MTNESEKRKSERIEDAESGIGVAVWQREIDSPVDGEQLCRFIGIHNLSDSGMMIETPEQLKTNVPVIVRRYLPGEEQWKGYQGEAVWSVKVEEGVWHSGLQVGRWRI